MANTISRVETANTFNQWRIQTNELIQSANQLRTGHYYKDNGSFILATGDVTVEAGAVSSLKSNGTGLSVVANGIVQQILTVGGLRTTGDYGVILDNIAITSTATLQAANITLANITTLQTGNATFGNVIVSDSIRYANGDPFGAQATWLVVKANDAIIAQNTALNFNNTATVQVAVSHNVATNSANIEFKVDANTIFGNNLTEIIGEEILDLLPLGTGPEQIPQNKNLGTAAYANTNAFATPASVTTAHNRANAAFNAANTAANTVQVFQQNTVRVSGKPINLQNSSTVGVTVTDSLGRANIVFTVQEAGIGMSDVKSQMSIINTTFGTTNSTFNTVNTAIENSSKLVSVAANNAVIKDKAKLHFKDSDTIKIRASTSGSDAVIQLDAVGGGGGSVGNAGNTAQLSVNAASILYDRTINFINSRGVGISAAAAGASQANITIAQVDRLVNLGSGAGSVTINYDLGAYFYRTISGTTVFSFTGTNPAGAVQSFILQLTGGGSYTITWPAGIKWANATAPALSTAAQGVDLLGFVYNQSLATWYGILLAKGLR